ncbi:hypothetical protein CHRY9390_01513 [Chryseobacterium aquaeductus]|uniref:Uncharacterized protein n=1 Tax=Chryseobacterium aquaeductus TaxID=2675056 RepID=A0A9N8MG65_9FLAO|nr:hypothetical protein [Chryseobacterium aquaeductus]CAA7330840.1 hypothetical protein CHRY9390_01513 [Chryseobacterium potabilaquae]CAD7806453.1 hypothetical protein CHRY9390_01513 [Chryseobacterium aquaeductus]
MKKPWVKKLLIGLGVLFGIILLANFGVNIWLKTQLPNYIKKNTDYKISYKSLNVDLGTGNIFATGITVNNKDPQNVNVIGFQGTIDSLNISRFGIYDAIFNKEINSSDISLAKPNLNIILAKPADKKKAKNPTPFNFDNIRISNGKIQIFRHTKQRFFSVSDLDLVVENLQMTEESVQDKLPVIFDRYSIEGKDFFFQPDDIYTLKINKITTTNGQVSIDQFQLTPLLDFDQFKKLYPKKPQLYQLNVQKIDFKDVVLKDKKVSLSNATFQNPNILVYTTNAIPDKVKKPFNFELDLADFNFNNANIQVNKPDGNKLLFAKNIHLNIKNLEFNKEISEEMIPLRYKDFNFSGKDIQFFNHQDVHVGSIVLSPKKGDIRNVSVVPNRSVSGKSTMNLKANQIAFYINKWEIVEKKLSLDVQNVLVNQVNGTITAGMAKSDRKSDFSGIQFPIVIRNVNLKNSNIIYDSKQQPLKFNDLNASIKNIELTEKPKNGGLAFKVKDYKLTTKNFAYKTKFYNMTASLLELDKNKVKIDQFAMKPLVSRSQFIRMIPVESDLYDLKANQITAVGKWDLFSENKFIHANAVTILSANANIFRSKIPADDPKEKALYSRLLRSIKIPMFVDQLNLKNSVLEYEEDTPKSSGPGKLTFTNFNMNVKNLNSAKMKGKPTQVDIKIDCTFMKTSPLSVNWGFNTADQSDRFSIAGKLSNIPAVALNAFVVPYMSITATGTIQEMEFNFKGNPKGIGGNFSIKHKDLKVSILDKDSKKKKGVLSAVANIFIKSDSGKFPESVMIEGVERDPTKSFFNLFWKGIEDGLKKTLIGINVDKTEKTIEKTKNTVKDVKNSVKEVKNSVKEAEKDISKTVAPTEKNKPEKQKEKKGLFKKVFQKKENPKTE